MRWDDDPSLMLWPLVGMAHETFAIGTLELQLCRLLVRQERADGIPAQEVLGIEAELDQLEMALRHLKGCIATAERWAGSRPAAQARYLDRH